MDIVGRDLKDMDTTWDEAEGLATDSRMASTCGPMQPSGCGLNYYVRTVGFVGNQFWLAGYRRMS